MIKGLIGGHGRAESADSGSESRQNRGQNWGQVRIGVRVKGQSHDSDPRTPDPRTPTGYFVYSSMTCSIAFAHTLQKAVVRVNMMQFICERYMPLDW